jgi:hypothetical protein
MLILLSNNYGAKQLSEKKKTKGAWLIYHSKKLQGVAGAVDFQLQASR